MSNTYIVPLDLGKKLDTDAVIVAFYVKDGTKNILVDTGYSIDYNFLKYFPEALTYPFERKEEQELPRVLHRLGLEIADIDIIINTHLDMDHCTNDHLFVRAEVFVQRKEVQFRIAPDWLRKLKIPETPPRSVPGAFLAMLSDGIPINFTLVDGHQDITDHVSVLPTPGHSPGHQSVVVKTDKRTIILAGDNVPKFENWEKWKVSFREEGTPAEQIILKSYEAMKKLSPDLVLPSHDAKVFQNKIYT